MSTNNVHYKTIIIEMLIISQDYLLLSAFQKISIIQQDNAPLSLYKRFKYMS